MTESKKPEKNAWVFPIEYTSNGLGFRLLTIDEPPLRLQFAIIVEDDTSMDQIRKAWEEIDKNRKVLTSIIGSDLNNKYDRVLLELSHQFDVGRSYGEIAKSLNYQSLALICRAYYSGEKWEKETTWGMGITNLLFLYIGLRLETQLLKKQIDEGYELLEDGRVPWNMETGPFTTARIRDQIVYLRDRVNSGKIVIPDHPSETSIMVDAYLLKNGWYEKANRLIQRADKDYWKRHQKWIMNRKNVMMLDLETSTGWFLEEFRIWLKNGGKT